MGSKRRHLPFINNLVNKTNKINYCEPFLGSGIVFLNLEKDFSNYYLNDIQEENTLAFKNANLLNEEYIRKINNFCIENYPETYDGYYSFRNNLLNKTNNSCLEKTIYIVRIYSLCMNSSIHFGKHGFNSSYGNHGKFNVDNYISFIKIIQNRKSVISNKSFSDCLAVENALYFLDPPYITNAMALSNKFDENQLQTLVDFLLKTDNDFIYFDTENNINSILKDKFNFSYINKIYSVTRPYKRKPLKEICFWRIN